MKTILGVIGGASVSEEIYQLAREVGREIARAGAVLVCGGRSGVMEAVSRGAHETGGLVVGILPGASSQEANPYVDIPIVTNMGLARNAIIVQTAHALIAIDGSYGTLSELAFALQLGKPIVGLRTWEISPQIPRVQTAAEAVRLTLQALRERVA